MGRRQFYAWVDQAYRETSTETSPDSWEGAERDPWWQQAREKRAAILRGG